MRRNCRVCFGFSEGEVQEPWFDERNVVLRASSRTLWANQVYSLNKIAISAARDAMCLKKHLRPPAVRGMNLKTVFVKETAATALNFYTSSPMASNGFETTSPTRTDDSSLLGAVLPRVAKFNAPVPYRVHVGVVDMKAVEKTALERQLASAQEAQPRDLV